MSNPNIWRYAGTGAAKLRGRAQSPEHVEKRLASSQAAIASQVRTCVRCSAFFNPSSPGQKYCNLGCWTAGASAKRAKRHHRAHVSNSTYETLTKKFGEVCMICAGKARQRLAIDHCHATGRIRGLLCHRCNTAIGLLRDSPELLANAIAYLNTSKEKPHHE